MAVTVCEFPWLKPVACQILGGVFDPKKMRFPFNFIPAMRKIPPSDARNWTAIRAWAGELAVTFAQGQPHPQEVVSTER